MYYLISLEDDSRFFAFNHAQSLDFNILSYILAFCFSSYLSFSIYDSFCVFDTWVLDK